WLDRSEELHMEVDRYAETHSKCIVLENCRTAEAACAAIESAVNEHDVRCVVVDYAQLLQSPGRSRYEQVTNTSIALRQLASANKLVVLVLCQISRGIESRERFEPTMSDLKDTGQLEQDADVIVFLCWPCRLNHAEPQDKFQFFIC